MKAIQTKILPWTDIKPTRIKASAEGVKSITYSKNSLEQILLDLNLRITEENIHSIAAGKFAHAYGWLTLEGIAKGDRLVSGGYGDGLWFHCFSTSKQ